MAHDYLKPNNKGAFSRKAESGISFVAKDIRVFGFIVGIPGHPHIFPPLEELLQFAIIKETRSATNQNESRNGIPYHLKGELSECLLQLLLVATTVLIELSSSYY